MSFPEKTLTPLLIFGWFLLFYPKEAMTDQIDLIPSIAVKESYNSNVLYTIPENEKSDFQTDISPALHLSRRTERMDTGVKALAGFHYHHDYDEYNSIDQRYDAWISYHMMPRLKLGALLLYKVDSTQDREIDETGSLFDTTKRRVREGNGSAKFIASENTTIEFSGSFSDFNFNSDTYLDSWYSGVSGLVSTDISRILSSTYSQISLSQYHYDYDQTMVDNYSITWGLSYRLTEIVQLFANAGPSFTKSKYSIDTLDFESDDRGWTGTVGGSYQGEFIRGNLNVSKGIEHSSKWSGVSDRSSVTGSLERQMTKKMSWGTGASFYINREENQFSNGSENKEETWSSFVQMIYNFSKDMQFTTGYRYSQVDYPSGQKVNRHIFDFQVYLKRALLEK